MKKQLSPHAHVAKIIRTQLKEWGIKSKVTSDSFAGGNSVRVEVIDQPKEIIEKIEDFTDQFKYGHFNGMEDIYEYSNTRSDIPQVKYLSIDNSMSDSKRQEIYTNLRNNMSGWENLSERYEEAKNHRFDYGYVSNVVWREFCNPSY